MAKTVIEKSQSPSPNVTVFSVSGTLGFHEKETLEKLFDECKKRKITRVVMDVNGLSSLGGGCASIIKNVAARGELAIGIACAKATVLKFLKNDDERLVFADSIEDAVAKLADTAAAPLAAETGETDSPAAAENTRPCAPGPPEGPVESVTDGAPPCEVEQSIDAASIEDGASSRGDGESEPTAPEGIDSQSDSETKAAPRELRKRIIQYNTLFSINSDFARIPDRKSLLDLFLLTTIAQVGVECAFFMEYREGYFTPAAAKGLEPDELKGFVISAAQLNLEEWKTSLEVYAVETAKLADEIKAPLLSLGCTYIAPFVAHDQFRGILGLGKPLRSALDEGTVSFLKILINQAAIAYESTQRFEEEKERTLGLVQTLISLIEENTLARGNTNFLSNYTYVLANKIHYSEVHIRDLMYGAVLRDIGMIKVSDLIVRSPRELMPEEWEIIKRHPIDGAEMLRKMKFSDHAVNIVLSHHERFNGEGYPSGLQGKQIPMGARIVSVVESYAAMLHDRPTRPALTHEEALNTLKENWGMRYDPELVKNFVQIIEEELRTGEKAQESQFELFRV